MSFDGRAHWFVLEDRHWFAVPQRKSSREMVLLSPTAVFWNDSVYFSGVSLVFVGLLKGRGVK